MGLKLSDCVSVHPVVCGFPKERHETKSRRRVGTEENGGEDILVNAKRKKASAVV